MSKILVSGFTFIKNGLTLGYPIKESIESIEPLCDEIVINVGFDNKELKGDDGTFEYLNDHFNHSKFKFIKSYWDPEMTSGGLVLSEQTNIALKECKGDYCQYIQGDEAIHENDLANIHNSIMELEKRPEIDGLIYKYLHFYGNVDIVKKTRTSYRREVRLIRNFRDIVSWKDAQGFRKSDGSKITAKMIDATIYHYGWARKDQVMAQKVASFDKLYHGKDFESEKFQYERVWGLKKFQETHPEVMKEWIETHKNDLDIMALPLKNELKNVGLAISDFIETLSGYRMGEYKNYIEIH